MNIRRQKGVLLFGAASLGVAINVSTSLASANKESKGIENSSKRLGFLLKGKDLIFSKFKNYISSVVSYLISKLSNLNNEELYDSCDEYVANLWNEYHNATEEYNDEFKGVEKPDEIPIIKEKLKEKSDYINALYEKLLEILEPYAKLLVNPENLELRMNKKNDKILITMTDNTTNVGKCISLDFLCEVLEEFINGFSNFEMTDHKKIAHNCGLLHLLTKRKQQFSLLTVKNFQREELTEISNIIDSISSSKKSNKDVVKYLKNSFENLNTKVAYIKEVFGEKFKPHDVIGEKFKPHKVFGEKFKPHKVTPLENFGRLKNHILKKIKSQKSEVAKEIVEDFNLSAKELFPNEYEDLLIKSQE